jgi:hypothetical protein
MTPVSEQSASGVIFAKDLKAYHQRLTVRQYEPLESFIFGGDRICRLISRS